jgi:SAM-dependent methyltransferase
MDVERRADPLVTFAVAAHWHTVDLLYEPTLSSRLIGCTLCGHAATRDGYRIEEAECQFAGGRLERYQCPDCDLVFGPLKMLDLTGPMLAADYRLLYETYREGDSTARELRAFRSTEPTRGELILNWGCGARSESVDMLRADGWDAWGFEPSVGSTSPFVAGHLAEISATFDRLFSNNVIEHFRDPVSEFREMASHLRSGALMTHATPCYEMKCADTRFHTAFYLGRSVEVLASRTGLELVRREHDGDYMSTTFRVP